MHTSHTRQYVSLSVSSVHFCSVTTGADVSISGHIPTGADVSISVYVPTGGAVSISGHVPTSADASIFGHVPVSADASISGHVPTGAVVFISIQVRTGAIFQVSCGVYVGQETHMEEKSIQHDEKTRVCEWRCDESHHCPQTDLVTQNDRCRNETWKIWR